MMKKLLVTMCVAAAMLATANAQDVSGTYAGMLNVDLGMDEPTQQEDTIYLAQEEAGTYALSIKDFAYGEGEQMLPIGDLELTGIAAAEADGVLTLTKEELVDGPEVLEMFSTKIQLISASVQDNKLALELSVFAYMKGMETGDPSMTIAVSFEGTKVTDGGQSGIASLVADQAEITVWGNEMMVRGAAEYTIYNTAGVPVQQGVADGSIISLDNLGGGIYLVKAGNRIEKFIKK